MSDLQYIKGIGPSRVKILEEAGITTGLDALYYFPNSYIDRQGKTSIKELFEVIQRRNYISSVNPERDGNFTAENTIIGKVKQAKLNYFRTGKQNFNLLIEDESGKAQVNFWFYAQSIAKKYHEGQLLIVSGKPTIDRRKLLTFTHPDIDIISDEDVKVFEVGGIIPKYRMSKAFKGKINQKMFRNIITNVIEKEISKAKETLPGYLLEKHNFLNIQNAIRTLHFPSDRDILEKCRNRIKYEELFYYYLMIAERKKAYATPGTGLVINPKSKSARELYESLPFDLTKDQKYVLNEIARDCKSSKPMNRLLQGDVGSGKTIVSLLAMLPAVDDGFQAVIMAPTEILAEQHFLSIKKFLKGTDIKVVQLVGGQRNKARLLLLDDIATGKANIIVGTHALFQSSVKYNKLGFIVIDEQHRFGVNQRTKLFELARKSLGDEAYKNGVKPHLLYTTATPIPRSLMMTVTGDLDVSFIKSKPKNRIPIHTKIGFESEKDKIYDNIRKEVKQGRQAFIVCPFIEETEKSLEMDVKTAIEQHEYLQNEVFPDLKCGLLHGAMFWYEKEEIMEKFAAGEYDIMVATTVIEVGIDIPNASIMLIENAERFGLAQLHQLRGRVGRGEHQSYCILMTKDKLREYIATGKDEDRDNQATIIRLKTMEESSDGFKISEIDMKLRGPGDIIGTKQSGLPEFLYADIVNDLDIMEIARRDVNEILASDPNLAYPQNKIISQTLEKKKSLLIGEEEK